VEPHITQPFDFGSLRCTWPNFSRLVAVYLWGWSGCMLLPSIIHNKVYNKLIMLCLRLPSSKAVHSSGTTNYSCRGTSVRLSTASCGCDTPCAEPLRPQEDHPPVGTAPEDAAYSAGNCLCMALCAIARHRGQGASTTYIASPKACSICAGLQESHACRERMNNN
jgi:hypothetical protein